MEKVKDYKCPRCGAALSYSAEDSTVVCKSCGEKFEIDSSDAGGIEFDWGNFRAGLSHETMEGTAVYQCENCGAVLETTETTVATSCPYCDSNVVLTDRVAAGFKPNAVIPFEVDKKELKEIVKDFLGKRKLLPDDYITDSKIDEILGVYVPFWLFDATVSGTCEFYGEIVTRTETEKEIRTKTDEYRLIREGTESFEKVPADASKSMEDALMDSVEPFDLSRAVNFKEDYLAGFLANRFDVQPEEVSGRIARRVVNSTISTLRSTTSRFTSVRETGDNLKMHDVDIKYVLFPVYIINASYEGQKYQYAVNGQTGKIVGRVPTSKKKGFKIFFKWFGIFFAVASIAMFLIQYYGA